LSYFSKLKISSFPWEKSSILNPEVLCFKFCFKSFLINLLLWILFKAFDSSNLFYCYIKNVDLAFCNFFSVYFCISIFILEIFLGLKFLKPILFL